jgi:hypothetical protein
VEYELLRLIHCMELNLTGLRKILKEFEKNLGGRVMEQYVSSGGQEPYSQLQQLFRTAVSEMRGKKTFVKIKKKLIQDTFDEVHCLSGVPCKTANRT